MKKVKRWRKEIKKKLFIVSCVVLDEGFLDNSILLN